MLDVVEKITFLDDLFMQVRELVNKVTNLLFGNSFDFLYKLIEPVFLATSSLTKINFGGF